ncbi:oxysterol-binding protein homolog 1 [Diutina catenulata]
MSSQLNTSLLRLKLLDALRSGHTGKLDELYSQLSATENTTATTDVTRLRETLLHYAVQVAPLDTIRYIVEHPERFADADINGQDDEGNTPLHLAAAASRLDVVKYLLSLPTINDTVVNVHKKQPVEVARDVNVAQLMQFERAKFVEKAAAQLRACFSQRDFAALDQLLVQNPRASELLDINGADPDTGNTVLHEFIKKDDPEMVEWILKHGGDPFKRDKRGALPADLIVNKDSRLKRIIKEASQEQNIMDPVIQGPGGKPHLAAAPTYKGYLKKWTNFASGYKLRYFVLDQSGVLSYYANQDDTASNACRGSLNLGYASLHLDSSEKCKFEILGKNGIRWHLRANYPVETNRWVWTLQNAITVAKDSHKRRAAQATSPQPQPRESFDSASSQASQHTQDSTRRRMRHKLRLSRRKHKGGHVPDVAPASYYDEMDCEDFDSDAEGSVEEVADEGPDTFSADVQSVTRALEVQLVSLQDLFNSMAADEVQAAGLTSVRALSELIGQYHTLVQGRDARVSKQLDRQREVNRLWEASIQQLESEIQNRDEKLNEYDGKQKQLKKYLLTQSGANTPNEGGPANPALEEILKTDSDDEFFDASEFEDDESDDDNDQFVAPRPPQARAERAEAMSPTSPPPQGQRYMGPTAMAQNMVGSRSEESQESQREESQARQAERQESQARQAERQESQARQTDKQASQARSHEPRQDDSMEMSQSESGEYSEARSEPSDSTTSSSTGSTTGAATGAAAGAGAAGAGAAGAAGAAATHPGSPDLDAIPEGKRVESVDPATKEPHDEPEDTSEYPNPDQQQIAKQISEEGSYLGYENPPRTKLAMDEDNRPKVGLWGILKSMIGKDMTRMTLPVSFNEPSSLLQRLVEDVECSYLLDTACQYDDSVLRLIYVATFAASEYASTIDRIAKPFNPLLGETFEYCRPDKNYRLIAEQVSHHPPISACHADSPKWTYYGENAVDSQFRGRSFDFKHLGKMFCVLRPDSGVVSQSGEQVYEELYSWKKVNTSVVGILSGSPTVDNFGLMTVTNHTTGDIIEVNLKQRGWSAKGAYQLSGTALNAKGEPKWAMGGHWNSKIYAKKVDGSHDRKQSLVEANDSRKVTTDPYAGGKFLVWQVAPRPKVPFNLTAFAVTLNNPDPKLLPWVAPTDTRLRPDQRDMEEGRYDQAADEKHRLEEKQRAARKRREQSNESYEPNWFTQRVHEVTGDKYWDFNGKYWPERRDKKLAGCGDIF